MQLYRKDNNRFEINFSAFHSTYEVDTPRYSARHLEHLHTREREHAIIKKAMETESLRSNNPSIRTVGTTTLENLASVGVSNQYTVESVGAMQPDDLVIQALDLLEEKCDLFLKELDVSKK